MTMMMWRRANERVGTTDMVCFIHLLLIDYTNLFPYFSFHLITTTETGKTKQWMTNSSERQTTNDGRTADDK
jgi:hypothetical protein